MQLSAGHGASGWSRKVFGATLVHSAQSFPTGYSTDSTSHWSEATCTSKRVADSPDQPTPRINAYLQLRKQKALETYQVIHIPRVN